MTSVSIDAAGSIALPEDIRQQYGFSTDTPIRLIKTRNGILLVPLTCEPMSAELLAELEQWQALSVQTWEMFPYEDTKFMNEDKHGN